MNQSIEVNELSAALAKAQGIFTNPPRNREVKVRTKAGDTYSFTYATLDAIMDMVRKPLADNGLAIVHSLGTDEQGPVCETRLCHASGQWLATWVPVIVAEGANAQGWGGAITYARRYGLCSLLAIAADEDDDANAACGNEATAAARIPRKPPAKTNGQKPDPDAQKAAAQRDIAAAEKWPALCELADRLKASAFLEPVLVELNGKLIQKMFNKMTVQLETETSAETLDKMEKLAGAYFDPTRQKVATGLIAARRAELDTFDETAAPA